MLISVIGLNHKTAPVEVRERLAFSEALVEKAISDLVKNYDIAEAVLLSTCNRVEIYSVLPAEKQCSARQVSDFFAEFFDVPKDLYESSLYCYEADKAARHIFYVASSLDSMVVGEPQILGQVKEWFQLSQRLNATGPILNEMFQRALRVGKRVRSETMIGRSAVSVPYVAVEMAKKIFPELDEKKVTLLGTGKMSEVTVKNLQNAGVREISVVSRTPERAQAVAERLGTTPLVFDAEYEFLYETDIMVTSTDSPHFLIKKDKMQELMRRRKQRLLFIVDIAVPRDVEPEINGLENVYLYNIDDLEQIVHRNREERKKEIQHAEEIVEAEVLNFCSWLASLEVTPALKRFRELLEEIRTAEVERLIRENKHFNAEQRKEIEYFSRVLINKIAHTPTERLKELACSDRSCTYAEVLRKLFDLDAKD
jgi:glutamyl-tRNA reductase